MNIEVIQHTNKEYYEEYYSEWLKYRSKLKKYEHIVGVSTILIGGILYLVNNSFYFITIGLLILGILMIYEFYSSKKKWLNERLKSKSNNTYFKILFLNDEMQTFGKFGTSKLKWDYISNGIITEKGLILIPEKGISIYLQKKCFNSTDEINQIVNKITDAQMALVE